MEEASLLKQRTIKKFKRARSRVIEKLKSQNAIMFVYGKIWWLILLFDYVRSTRNIIYEVC